MPFHWFHVPFPGHSYVEDGRTVAMIGAAVHFHFSLLDCSRFTVCRRDTVHASGALALVGTRVRDDLGLLRSPGLLTRMLLRTSLLPRGLVLGPSLWTCRPRLRTSLPTRRLRLRTSLLMRLLSG